MQRLDALIFDLEGTLVDSTIDIGNSVNALLAEEGRPPLTPEQERTCIAEGIMETCERALKATGGMAGTDVYPYVKRLVEHIRQDKPSPKQIYDFVPDMLKKYKGMGLKLGICTNKNEEATVKQLEALELLEYFDFIAGGNTFMSHKPNPDHVNGVLEKLDVTAANTLFVGDSMGDLLACEGAKVPCITISHGIGMAKDEKSVALIAEFDELDACIEKLGYKA